MTDTSRAIQTFETTHDIPYSIPLTISESDNSCVGKNQQLLEALRKFDYQVRWRVCTFKWSDLGLPTKVLSIPHNDEATHAYLEVFINNEWKTVDTSWDSKLKNVLPVTKWDGMSSTQIAVTPLEIYSPEKSTNIMNNLNEEEFDKEIKVNGEFYKELNKWLEEVRKSI